MPEQITLKTATVNAVLAFLGSQPYQSVAGLINAIQQEAAPQLPASSSSDASDE